MGINGLLNFLNLNGLNLTIYYIFSGSGIHDPQNLNLDLTIGSIKFKAAGLCLYIKAYNWDIIATHGDFIISGFAGFIISYLFKGPVVERMWRKLFRIGDDVWLITAHTHIPSIDYENKIANPGGWVEIPIFNPPMGYGILITSKNVSLVNIISHT